MFSLLKRDSEINNDEEKAVKVRKLAAIVIFRLAY